MNGGRRIPIVAMTANASKADREACLAVGMDDFVTKPITENAFIKSLKRNVQLLDGVNGPSAMAP